MKSIIMSSGMNSRINNIGKLTTYVVELLRRIRIVVNDIATRVYDYLEDNMRSILILGTAFSIGFGIIKTVFFTGYNVDSYQYYALSIEQWLISGAQDYLLTEYLARHRILYPFLIALLHILIPTDIAILACVLNLGFALGSVIVLRKILQNRDFSQFEIDLSSLLIILSYNFLNYWFNILTDMAGLFFLLIMLYFADQYMIHKSYRSLIVSVSALILCVMVREMYIIAAFVYIWMAKSALSKFIITCLIIIIGLISFMIIGNSVQILDFIISAQHHTLLESGDYLGLFIVLQQKWLNTDFTIGFLKGLLKVGIIPAFGCIILILLYRKNLNLGNIRKRLSEMDHIDFWFVNFFLIFTLVFANMQAPSGLRYWLPICWIPIIYVTKAINRQANFKTLKILVILFLALYPIAWSTGEWYVNRNVPEGTGPLTHQNYYLNEMDDLRTIYTYNQECTTISIVNGSYFNITHTPNESCNSSSSVFGLSIWIDIPNSVIVRTRVYSPNGARLELALLEAKRNFAPGWEAIRFLQTIESTPNEFEIYQFNATESFILRYISLSVEGPPNVQVIMDYLEIIAY